MCSTRASEATWVRHSRSSGLKSNLAAPGQSPLVKQIQQVRADMFGAELIG